MVLDTANPGLVVVLNGASSSGKTSIAREMAAALQRPTALVSVDSPLSLLSRSPAYAITSAAHAFSAMATNPRLGVVWPNVVAAITSAGEHAGRGEVAIVDVVVTHPVPAAFIGRAIAPSGLIVGVHCAIEELERRERRRPTRRGLASRQFASVHKHLTYDLIVDTTATTAEECASTVSASVLHRLRSLDPRAAP